jgi:hypothetical protein
MKSRIGNIIIVMAVAALIVISIDGKRPDAVSFKVITRDSLFGTLSWLFVVALFIERAVEVIVSTLRDAGADPLQHDIDIAQEKIDAQAVATPGAIPYLDQLHAAQRRLLVYRCDTKELAHCVSFILGLFVSLAGVRALGSIVDTVPSENWLFPTADIIITGAVLAGGTDAIHQMMNVITSFLGNAADKAKGS